MTLRRNIFLLLIVSVWLLVAGFVAHQYRRERAHNIERLNLSLQLINHSLGDFFGRGQSYEAFYAATARQNPDLRLTIVAEDGTVRYDSAEEDVSLMSNHRQRPEIQQALHEGQGYTIRRLSERLEREYFYAALRLDTLVVRTAVPYSLSLATTLEGGGVPLLFLALLTLVLSMAAVWILRKVRMVNRQLMEQQQRAHYEEAEKNRIKKQLTNNINHELKTPVSAIRGCLETLLENPDMESEMQRSFLEKSCRQVERLESLLRDVATLTRMDDGSVVIERQTIDLQQLLQSVVADFRAAHRECPMRVNVETGSEPLSIDGNETLLRSIFTNLIENAAAYSGGRDCTIRFEGCNHDDEEDYYRFTVEDNGIGVEEEHLSHLFERFYRIDKGRSRKMGGTGLGLSIVKNAVVWHGGEIEVHNRPQGGLQFRFTLRH